MYRSLIDHEGRDRIDKNRPTISYREKDKIKYLYSSIVLVLWYLYLTFLKCDGSIFKL